MIKAIEESYKVLPKVNGETERVMYVFTTGSIYRLRLTVAINDVRYGAEEPVSRLGLDTSIVNLEQTLINRMCLKLLHHLSNEGVI
ncbi:hypothetical protein D3C71_234440 [compost metagenome]